MDTSETYIKMSGCPEVQEACSKLNEGYSPTYGLWIPTQCMIQEMCPAYGHFEKHTNLLLEFMDWYNKQVEVFTTHEKLEQRYTTLEQLWLAFYMWERHEKVWNGDEWIAGLQDVPESNGIDK